MNECGEFVALLVWNYLNVDIKKSPVSYAIVNINYSTQIIHLVSFSALQDWLPQFLSYFILLFPWRHILVYWTDSPILLTINFLMHLGNVTLTYFYYLQWQLQICFSEINISLIPGNNLTLDDYLIITKMVN